MSPPSSLDFADATLEGQLARRAQSFLALDIRIAQLCHALRLELVSDTDLQGILDRTAPGFAHTASPRGPGRAVDRLQVEREELRGLLVMRFELLIRAVDEWGREATLRMVEFTQSDLRQRGLVRATDGLALIDAPASAA